MHDRITLATNRLGILEITQSWFQPAAWLQLPFALLMGTWLLTEDVPHHMLLWPGLVACHALYYLLNSTRVRLDAEVLVRRVGPLPWFGNREIALVDIIEFKDLPERRVFRGRAYSPHQVHHVYARLRCRRWVRLLSMESPSNLEQVLHALATHLKTQE